MLGLDGKIDADPNGTYLSRKVVSDAWRRWYLLSPRRRPGPNFRHIAAQTKFDPGLRRGDNLEIGARNQFAVKFGVQSSKVSAIRR